MTHRLPAGSVPRYEAPKPIRYSLGDLERETGVNPRTIRYYITEGLLQPAYGRGPSATYDPDHLLRLRLIQHFKEQHLSLKEIKDQLAELTSDDITMMLNIEMQPTSETFRHYRISDDVEIVIREQPSGERKMTHEHAYNLIVEYARSVLDDLREAGEPFR